MQLTYLDRFPILEGYMTSHFFYNMQYEHTSILMDRYFTYDPTIRKGRGVNNCFDIVQKHFRTEQCRFFFTNRVIYLWKLLCVEVKSILPPADVSKKFVLFIKAVLKHYANKTMCVFDIICVHGSVPVIVIYVDKHDTGLLVNIIQPVSRIHEGYLQLNRVT